LAVRKIRYYIFLKDILIISLSAFGGAQVHLTLFLDRLVTKRAYLSEKELMELHALCQLLPGGSSTQMITAIGFRIGGLPLAYLGLLAWILPAMLIMTAAGIFIVHLDARNAPMQFVQFVQPMAVGFVSYAAWRICKKTLQTKTSVLLMIASAGFSVFFNTPYSFPIIILIGGFISSFKYHHQPKEETPKLTIKWDGLVLWIGVLIGAAIIGKVTGSLPVRLFENFYRNGSLIFGGGQVLVPFLYTEFVDFKDYLSSEEFLSGFGIAQAIPGPTFSFSAYVGVLSMREYGWMGQLFGGFLATAGIFLPGTFLIFFLIRFWDQLKKYRAIKASLEGITAVSAGMVVAAAFILYIPVENTWLNNGIIVLTTALLLFTRIPAPIIVLVSVIAGLLF
jgi:chromate transporter